MSKNAPTYAAITRQIWWDLFNQFRHDIPDRFTEKEAQELLGVTESGARDIVLPWLKQVDC